MTHAADHSDVTRPLASLRMADSALVGGKNASLGEMIGTLSEHGIDVPDGFAVTVEGYRQFLAHNGLAARLADLASGIEDDLGNLDAIAASIQAAFTEAEMPEELAAEIDARYADLCEAAGETPLPVAIRSSATAEDLPDASFAGQQATFLYVEGPEQVKRRVRDCFASLFTPRAIAYRMEHGFGQDEVALSVGVQRMVRTDRGAAGVAFSIDTETGDPNVVVINGAFGLGESVVQGAVDPDEFQVFTPLFGDGREPIVQKTCGDKHIRMVPQFQDDGGTEIVSRPNTLDERTRFCLDDTEILQLAQWVARIARHYDRPMDVEWARDGVTGAMFIVQARPETVESRRGGALLQRYRLAEHGAVLTEGVAIGDSAAAGRARVLKSPDEHAQFQDNEVLVTEMTDPDWLPVMRRAAAIVTERGGRTSHAAIVSRELGLPAVTGAPDATRVVETGQDVTVACCEGTTGRVLDGKATIHAEEIDLAAQPETRTQVMLNVADPARVQRWWRLPADGVGLARMEFIVANHIKAHPLALIDPDSLEDAETRQTIKALIRGHPDGEAYFVEQLSRGIARIAATFWPKPVLVRTSDFKTNEYAELLGGPAFEPQEENPMLGWRGVSRYLDPAYAEAFGMECRALNRVRQHLGFTNVHVMLPFCRTPDEGRAVQAVMARHGLVRHRDGLTIHAMCEVPSNVLLVDAFCELFDGFSIGSNDLTQLVLGVERDSERLAGLFDELDPAVRQAIETVIDRAHAHGRKVGLCGQGPSDRPDIARFLVQCGIDSVSVSPDSFDTVKRTIAEIENEQPTAAAAAE